MNIKLEYKKNLRFCLWGAYILHDNYVYLDLICSIKAFIAKLFTTWNSFEYHKSMLYLSRVLPCDWLKEL